MADIAIIENRNDIDEALMASEGRDVCFLSVSAEASYGLVKKGIKFVTEEDVLLPEEFKRIGDENFEVIERWISSLENRLESAHPSFKDHHFQPFRWNFYRMKILVDAVRTRAALLYKLIDIEKPSRILAVKGASAKNIHDYHLFFRRADSLYGLLAEKIALKKGIILKVLKSEASLKRVNRAGQGLTKPLFYLRSFVAALFKLGKLTLPGRGSGNVLCGTLYYDIMELIRGLSAEFNFYIYDAQSDIRLVTSPLTLKSKNGAMDFPECQLKGQFQLIRPTEDEITNDILCQRVERYAELYLPFLWRKMKYLESVDKIKDFKAYLHNTGSCDAVCGIPVSYFSRINKPVIVVQHGAYGFAENRITKYCEFGHSGYFLSWGNGIAEAYEKQGHGACKFISTGSSLISKIKGSSKKRSRISRVCYVPGLYRGYEAYFPNGQPCLDSKQFLLETGFMSTLKNYANTYKIVYKMAPSAARYSALFGSNPMLSWIPENLPNVTIDSRPLTAVIQNFDLFIIDWPSTTLIQALASGAEVLVYVGNPYFRITDGALTLLRRRALVGIDEDDFKDKIKFILDKGTVMSNTEDTSFLEKYGIHRDDGKSLDRMAEFMRDLL